MKPKITFRKILGTILIALPFIAIFCIGVSMIGIVGTAIVFVISALIILCIWAGVTLTSSPKE